MEQRLRREGRYIVQAFVPRQDGWRSVRLYLSNVGFSQSPQARTVL